MPKRERERGGSDEHSREVHAGEIFCEPIMVDTDVQRVCKLCTSVGAHVGGIGAAVKHYTAMTVYFHVSRSNDSGQWPLASRSRS